MAYIGNTVQNQGFTPAIDYFNGNGVTVTFTLSRPIASVAQVIVAVDNVIQNPSSAFGVVGNSITFTSAPLSGTNNIWVEYTSLITTYQGISQDPTVIGDIRATGGYLAEGDFGNSFVDGNLIDYVTGAGRLTVGELDDLVFYHGGTSARSEMMRLSYAGNSTLAGGLAATGNITTTGNVGIGTTSPVGKLEVNSAGNPKSITSYSTVNFAAIGAGSAGSGIFYGTGTFFTFNSQPFADRGTDNNLTERMRIDSSGYVTTPYQPAFYGFRNGGNVSATNTVVHNAVITNIGSCYNASTGVFTCPVAGVYEVMVGGHGEGAQPVVMQIKQNGTVKSEEYGNGAAFLPTSCFAILSCAAGDTIIHVVSVGTFWGGNDSGLRMSVKLIG